MIDTKKPEMWVIRFFLRFGFNLLTSNPAEVRAATTPQRSKSLMTRTVHGVRHVTVRKSDQYAVFASPRETSQMLGSFLSGDQRNSEAHHLDYIAEHLHTCSARRHKARGSDCSLESSHSHGKNSGNINTYSWCLHYEKV